MPEGFRGNVWSFTIRVLLTILLSALFIINTSCSPPNRIDFDGRTITNNLWGAGPNETINSGIFLNKDETFGWYWERLDPKKKPDETFIIPIYPSVRIGGSISMQTNTVFFPIKVGEIKSLNFDIAYKYLKTPEGAYNLAYEMFISSKDQPASNLIPEFEVMIWLHSTFPQPPNTYQGDVSDGINTYELYEWIMRDGRTYASFNLKGQPQFQAEHTVDVRRLLDNLTLDSNWYLLGVELGNEVVSGSGKIEINKLKITLNGAEVKGRITWWQRLFN